MEGFFINDIDTSTSVYQHLKGNIRNHNFCLGGTDVTNLRIVNVKGYSSSESELGTCWESTWRILR